MEWNTSERAAYASSSAHSSALLLPSSTDLRQQPHASDEAVAQASLGENLPRLGGTPGRAPGQILGRASLPAAQLPAHDHADPLMGDRLAHAAAVSRGSHAARRDPTEPAERWARTQPPVLDPHVPHDLHLQPVSAVVSAGGVVIGFGMACMIGFPLPFTILTGAPATFVVFDACFTVLWGNFLRSNQDVLRELDTYVVLVMQQTALIFTYAVYSYFFNNLSPQVQPAFALLLPVLKLLFKNWINTSVQQIGDFKPEVLIFHALNVAFAMQSATSKSTVFALIVVNCIHGCTSLRRASLLAEPWITTASAQPSTEDQSSVVPTGKSSASVYSLSIFRLVLFILEIDKSVLESPSIQLRSCPQLHQTRSKAFAKPKHPQAHPAQGPRAFERLQAIVKHSFPKLSTTPAITSVSPGPSLVKATDIDNNARDQALIEDERSTVRVSRERHTPAPHDRVHPACRVHGGDDPDGLLPVPARRGPFVQPRVLRAAQEPERRAVRARVDSVAELAAGPTVLGRAVHPPAGVRAGEPVADSAGEARAVGGRGRAVVAQALWRRLQLPVQVVPLALT